VIEIIGLFLMVFEAFRGVVAWPPRMPSGRSGFQPAFIPSFPNCSRFRRTWP